jgi:hypothetical protein
MLKNRSQQPFKIVLRYLKLLKDIFAIFLKKMPILIEFLLNKRSFERLEGYHFFG